MLYLIVGTIPVNQIFQITHGAKVEKNMEQKKFIKICHKNHFFSYYYVKDSKKSLFFAAFHILDASSIC